MQQELSPMKILRTQKMTAKKEHKLMGYNILRKDYYKFKDVDKTLGSKKLNKSKKSKKKSR